ncbi:MAG TPA: ABC transporter permease, partial [Acidimicrobiales bacterium]
RSHRRRAGRQAAARPGPVVSTGVLHPNALRQGAALVRRSVVGTLREAHLLAPSLVFPLFFAALSSASFNRAVSLPGFPEVDSFLDFLLAGTILQGVMFGSVQGATGLATDIEQGFFERLLASPVARTSIVAGRLGSAFVMGAAQALLFTVVFVIFGVTIKSGPVGFVILLLAGGLIALAFGSLMGSVAIRTGSQEAVQGAFPLVFISLFLSSAFFPRETMSGWYRRVADVNPVSHIAEGLRQLVIGDLTLSAVARAIGIPLAISALGIALAVRSLNRRIAKR